MRPLLASQCLAQLAEADRSYVPRPPSARSSPESPTPAPRRDRRRTSDGRWRSRSAHGSRRQCRSCSMEGASLPTGESCGPSHALSPLLLKGTNLREVIGEKARHRPFVSARALVSDISTFRSPPSPRQRRGRWFGLMSSRAEGLRRRGEGIGHARLARRGPLVRAGVLEGPRRGAGRGSPSGGGDGGGPVVPLRSCQERIQSSPANRRFHGLPGCPSLDR